MVFCVQMGPKPLSQSIPQASWGAGASALSSESGLLAPISPRLYPQEFTWSLNLPPTPPRTPPRSDCATKAKGIGLCLEKM